MELAEYHTRISAEADLLRSAAVAAGGEASVPTCPGWTVHRLVTHMVRVIDMMMAALLAHDPSTPPPRGEAIRGKVDVRDEFDTVLADFDDRLTAVLDLMRSTDPDTPTWHFSPTAPHTAAFWSRRLAHEITVHRIDAQSAAGIEGSVEPAFAADGIDEVLTRLITRRTEEWAVATLSGSLLYHAADAGRAWTVRLVPGQLPQTTPEAATEPDASVVGLADAVYRAAWGRPSGAVVSGDTDLVAATRAG